VGLASGIIGHETDDFWRIVSARQQSRPYVNKLKRIALVFFCDIFLSQCLMSLSGSAVAMMWEGHAADAEPI